MSIHGYQPYKPKDYTQSVLRATKAVLIEYEAWDRPMSVRQIFYRLVAQYGFDKTENAYQSLIGYIGRSRRAFKARVIELVGQGLSGANAGVTAAEDDLLIPFEWVRDDRGESHEDTHYESVEEYLEAVQHEIEYLQKDRAGCQKRALELWCEAGGMVPLMREIARPYGLRVSSGHGYDSVTAKNELADRIARTWIYERRPTTVLHIGDFDPSGEGLFHSLSEDVTAMVWQLIDCEPFAFERMGLTEEQVLKLDVETAPPKKTDSRYRGFLAAHPDAREHFGSDNITVQLEALAPPELIELIQTSIEAHQDNLANGLVREQEVRLRREIRERLSLPEPEEGE
jgi:hypothetical protein